MVPIEKIFVDKTFSISWKDKQWSKVSVIKYLCYKSCRSIQNENFLTSIALKGCSNVVDCSFCGTFIKFSKKLKVEKHHHFSNMISSKRFFLLIKLILSIF
jgi:hypothetical protein